MESAQDSFSFLVQKNMRAKGKCFGSDAQGVNLLVPEKTYPGEP